MIFIDACFKKETPYTPIWMMRQAGRYLSEYQETRKKAGSFLELCKNSDLATEVTLQPVEILDVDAAILFSDILVVPLEMGLDLEFIPTKGPHFLQTITDLKSVESLKSGAAKNLEYVYATISQTRKKLAKDKALIGFCGSPWTLATYMIEGEGSKTYAKSKKMLYSEPKILHALLEKLTIELIEYLSLQIQAGVNAVMVFDSWANALEKEAYLDFSWHYMKMISKEIKKRYSHVPIILFPKGIGGFLDSIDGEFDVLGIDWSVPLENAKKVFQDKYVLQGNLEPARLYSKKALEEGVERILKVMGNKGHIFNLGHGMLPDLPRENAKYLVQLVRSRSKR
ncbi:uroporphyrinogen decarboxylase [Helicobacter cetorum]|uniref:Uroporphyrinogen decarboxylase n=1 Tax=Helicobacter cetorum (strain ATCC BAA-540 / CCUG 52418 / MIT 99-5656) TaxID=1163745 RepID=I0EQR0_HELCM|nr:uroporphyrinogen decarboxylase [Helicobacter cetorum]AFI05279.1 uroporphyrinogen decarboxylase [Helicobacter cetorum MIT 99-5656]